MSFTKIVIDWIIRVVNNLSWAGVLVLMVMESTCLPIPSEVVMPLAGFVLCKTKADLILYTTIGTIANLIGSWIAYLIGSLGGRPFLIKYGRYVMLNEEELERAKRLFDRYGDLAVLIGRMLPAIRTVISLPAGIFLMNSIKFTLYTVLGSIPWNFILTFLGYRLGAYWYLIEEHMKYVDILIIFLAILIILYFILRKKVIR